MKNFFDAKIKRALAGILITALLMFSREVVDSLDVHLYYSADFVIDFFNNISADQARRYLQQEVLDLFFMCFYARFFYLALQKFYTRASWLAPTVWLFDFIETSMIILCLEGLVFPQQIGWLGVFTALKWVLVAVISGVIVGGASRR